MPKRHEFRIDLRLFVRAGSEDQADAFGKAVAKLVDQMAKDFLTHRVSLTGVSSQVEDLDEGEGLTIVKKG